MSPPIYTPDGSEVSEIVLPDGSTASQVIGPDGNVVFEAGPDIPDSVVHQYSVTTFGTSTWTDNVGSGDMSVNGMVSSTFSNGEPSVFGDGVDDIGTASGPENLPTNASFGVALTIEYPTPDAFDMWMSSADAGGEFDVRDPDGDGTIQLSLVDSNGDVLRVKTDGTFDDGNAHAVIINKSGDGSGTVDIFVDDITTPKPTSEIFSNFSSGSYSNTTDMGFFARNNNGTPELHIESDAGIFEFNTAPYTQSEREGFISRRPEV